MAKDSMDMMATRYSRVEDVGTLIKQSAQGSPGRAGRFAHRAVAITGGQAPLAIDQLVRHATDADSILEHDAEHVEAETRLCPDALWPRRTCWWRTVLLICFSMVR